jgi:hypothetical protein
MEDVADSFRGNEERKGRDQAKEDAADATEN